ncbi:MAG: hypothetical protein ABW321_31660 [Polyangiales bacterium]
MRHALARSIAALVIHASLVACGDDDTTDTGAPGAGVGAAGATAGATALPVGGSAGSAGPAAGSGTVTRPPTTGAEPTGPKGPGAGGTGAQPPASAGSGGTPGAGAQAPASAGSPSPTGGSGGAVGGAAGSGGAAGAANGGTDTSANNGTAIIRGDAPTDSTGTGLGPFKVSMYTDGFEDKAGFRAGTVYYPEDAEPPFAHVVFCPGFVSYQTSIEDWGPFLASYGIVIMTIDTNSSSDSVGIRKTALEDALASLQAENDRSDSPLKGKLALDRAGLMGWSMGGGASLLSSAMNPRYKSVVTVAEHLATSPGASAPLDKLTVPALMFAGTADTAILGLGMSQPAYDTIPESTSKLIYEVQGADHFFFNTPKALDGVVGKYGLAWQKVFLEGDERYKTILSAEGPMASDFRTNVQ